MVTTIQHAKDWRPLLSEMVPGEQYSVRRLLSMVNADRDADHYDARDLRDMIQTAGYRLSVTDTLNRVTYRLSIKYLTEITNG